MFSLWNTAGDNRGVHQLERGLKAEVTAVYMEHWKNKTYESGLK